MDLPFWSTSEIYYRFFTIWKKKYLDFFFKNLDKVGKKS